MMNTITIAHDVYVKKTNENYLQSCIQGKHKLFLFAKNESITRSVLQIKLLVHRLNSMDVHNPLVSLLLPPPEFDNNNSKVIRADANGRTAAIPTVPVVTNNMVCCVSWSDVVPTHKTLSAKSSPYGTDTSDITQADGRTLQLPFEVSFICVCTKSTIYVFEYRHFLSSQAAVVTTTAVESNHSTSVGTSANTGVTNTQSNGKDEMLLRCQYNFCPTTTLTKKIYDRTPAQVRFLGYPKLLLQQQSVLGDSSSGVRGNSTVNSKREGFVVAVQYVGKGTELIFLPFSYSQFVGAKSLILEVAKGNIGKTDSREDGDADMSKSLPKPRSCSLHSTSKACVHIAPGPTSLRLGAGKVLCVIDNGTNSNIGSSSGNSCSGGADGNSMYVYDVYQAMHRLYQQQTTASGRILSSSSNTATAAASPLNVTTSGKVPPGVSTGTGVGAGVRASALSRLKQDVVGRLLEETIAGSSSGSGTSSGSTFSVTEGLLAHVPKAQYGCTFSTDFSFREGRDGSSKSGGGIVGAIGSSNDQSLCGSRQRIRYCCRACMLSQRQPNTIAAAAAVGSSSDDHCSLLDSCVFTLFAPETSQLIMPSLTLGLSSLGHVTSEANTNTNIGIGSVFSISSVNGSLNGDGGGRMINDSFIHCRSRKKKTTQSLSTTTATTASTGVVLTATEAASSTVVCTAATEEEVVVDAISTATAAIEGESESTVTDGVIHVRSSTSTNGSTCSVCTITCGGGSGGGLMGSLLNIRGVSEPSTNSHRVVNLAATTSTSYDPAAAVATPPMSVSTKPTKPTQDIREKSSVFAIYLEPTGVDDESGGTESKAGALQQPLAYTHLSTTDEDVDNTTGVYSADVFATGTVYGSSGENISSSSSSSNNRAGCGYTVVAVGSFTSRVVHVLKVITTSATTGSSVGVAIVPLHVYMLPAGHRCRGIALMEECDTLLVASVTSPTSTSASASASAVTSSSGRTSTIGLKTSESMNFGGLAGATTDVGVAGSFPTTEPLTSFVAPVKISGSSTELFEEFSLTTYAIDHTDPAVVDTVDIGAVVDSDEDIAVQLPEKVVVAPQTSLPITDSGIRGLDVPVIRSIEDNSRVGSLLLNDPAEAPTTNVDTTTTAAAATVDMNASMALLSQVNTALEQQQQVVALLVSKLEKEGHLQPTTSNSSMTTSSLVSTSASASGSIAVMEYANPTIQALQLEYQLKSAQNQIEYHNKLISYCASKL